MSDINASYHCMQLQGKLMNQSWENGQKPSFESDFDPFWSKFGHPKPFWKVLPVLDVINFFTLSLYAI